MNSKYLRIGLVLAIIASGYGIMTLLKRSGPEPKQRQPQRMQTLVEVQTLRSGEARVVVEGMGRVNAAQHITLRAQVGGRIEWISDKWLEGAYFDANELMLRIEPDDYELSVARAESALAQRQSELAVEMGFQRVAEREWELLNETGTSDVAVDASLALREPQLKQAEAMQRSAEAELNQAELNLSRTQIRAPFDAMLLSRSVEPGALASTNAEVAELISTDAFHIQVAIPENRAVAIEIPGASASIRIRGVDTVIEGQVVSLLGDLDPQGQMARVLVEVKDPFALLPENAERPKLLLGAFVEVLIEGKPMPNAFEIPRKALQNGDVVWLKRPDGTLEIRPVQVAWRNRDTVLIRSGVEAGEQVILTPLSLASNGMLVRTKDDAPREAGSGQQK